MLNAFSSVISSFMDSATSKVLQNKENVFNAGEAQLNRDFQDWQRLMTQEFDLDMWNLNNEYNSLSSQLQRARDAGVSPNAILSGDYKGGFSNSVTSTPMSGAQASANNAGALGSAMIGRTPAMLNAVGNFIKNMTDSKVAMKQVQLNEKMIESNIYHNLASIQKMASEAGVNNATRDQIIKATSWMDKLNDLEVQERAARVTNWYNKNAEIIQQIKNLEADEALTNAQIFNVNVDTSLKLSQKSNVDSDTTYKDTLNKYADGIQEATLSKEQSEAAMLKLKTEFANELGIPLDSPEFMFNWKLAINGKFEEFCDKVIVPAEQSKWKPEDYTIPNFIPGSRNYWRGSFNPRTGITNPRLGNGTYFPNLLSPLMHLFD